MAEAVECATYTVKEAAIVIGISERRLYDRIRCGDIPCRRIGTRRYRFSREKLSKWLESEEVKQ